MGILNFLLAFVAAKTGLAPIYAGYLVTLAINGATWGAVVTVIAAGIASAGTAIFLAGGWAAFKATIVSYVASRGTAYAVAW